MATPDPDCRSARDRLSAFLDGVLPGDEETEVKRHLARCGFCGNAMMRQKAVRTLLRVRRSSLSGPVPDRVRLGVLSGLDEADQWSRKRRRGAVAALFAVAAFLLIGFSLGRFGAYSRLPSVEAETVNEHIRMILSGRPVMDVSGPDVEAVSRWLSGKLDIAVRPLELSPAGGRLVGGRVCYVVDRKVAYLFYQDQEHSYSLFIMAPQGVALPQGRDVQVGGRTFCLSSFKGYQLAVWEADGLLHSLVSDVPSVRIEQLARLALKS